MRPNDALHLVADVRDLQIVDGEGEYCGIVDDIELDGKPGGDLAVRALLVGPGAYRHRLPKAALWLVSSIAGERIVRVPWNEVKHVTSVVALKRPAAELGLAVSEMKAKAMLPDIGGENASL